MAAVVDSETDSHQDDNHGDGVQGESPQVHHSKKFHQEADEGKK